jgi:FkbH-like protein
VAERSRSCLLVSDFNAENLARYLRNDRMAPSLEPTVATFGDVVGTLLDAGSVAGQGYDFAVVWTQPEAVLESFEAVLSLRRPDTDALLAEVDRFADSLSSFAERVPFVLVPCWVVPTAQRGFGLIDWQRGGTTRALAEANLHLARRLERLPNCYLLDASRWVEATGSGAFSPKLWYMAKVPFAGPLFQRATAEIKAAARALAGGARKLVVVDLDDTLWGGLVGEVGTEGLRLGGHDAVGEAFVAFQKALRALRNRGVLIAIASKNEESVALRAIQEHPEMALRLEDFASWRIDWNDKASNVAELVAELNLGLDSVVFIDDNAAERARVREALPGVLVPDWPADKMLYAQTLQELDCFDSPQLSEEDAQRTEMYVSERERRRMRASVGSAEDWLRSLDLRVRVESPEGPNLKRCVQLLNKTNQMNLSTRRMTESEFLDWLRSGRRAAWCFRVSDRFGEAGITGLVSAELEGDTVRLVDFVLSCRVFGRQIERAMVHSVVDFAQQHSAKRVEATCLPTSKNSVCLEFWRGSGFTLEAENVFCWDASQPYRAPVFLSLE